MNKKFLHLVKRFNVSSCLKSSCVCVVFLGVSFFITTHSKIIRNVSDSHPCRYFFVLLKKKPATGDLAFSYSPFVNGYVIKSVLAKGPCSLVRSFSCLKKTMDGRNVTPNTDAFIPHGFCFLHSNHPRSFDSRYKEMGMIHENDILGVAYPVPFFKK